MKFFSVILALFIVGAAGHECDKPEYAVNCADPSGDFREFCDQDGSVLNFGQPRSICAPVQALLYLVQEGDYCGRCQESIVNIPSAEPSSEPSSVPSGAPSGSSLPSSEPSLGPSSIPSAVPSSIPSAVPSALPSAVPSALPSAVPSALPSSSPSGSSLPSSEPSLMPVL